MDQPVCVTVEGRLKEKWLELLDVQTEDIVTESNFFNLGGNSMLLLSLHVFMSQEFSLNFHLPELFANAEFGAMVLLVKTRIANNC